MAPTSTSGSHGGKPGKGKHGNGPCVEINYNFNFYNGDVYDITDSGNPDQQRRDQTNSINSALPFEIQEQFNSGEITYYDPRWGGFYYARVYIGKIYEIAEVARSCNCYVNGIDEELHYLDFNEGEKLEPSSFNSDAFLPAATQTGVITGDKLSAIADYYGVTLDYVLRANPDIKNAGAIYAGQTINIPAQAYTIKTGDTLQLISSHLNISQTSLEGLNPQLQDPNYLEPSEILKVPVFKANEPFLYTVGPRETLWSIAQKFSIALAELEKANQDIENKNLIYQGQIIRVPIYLPSQGEGVMRQRCNACEKTPTPTGAKFPMASPSLMTTTIMVGGTNSPIVAIVTTPVKHSKRGEARSWVW